ncbi:NLRC3 [Symbiodinium natans]|uniref:NLRC3 protein n=1 Tax=Symbiodinium natans TaxID=878477 RepID=A0A812KCL5_9DINO|nr:NLRC3 [Symbiodinium natans]
MSWLRAAVLRVAGEGVRPILLGATNFPEVAKQKGAVLEKAYSLSDRAELGQFILDANIGLVRAEYFYKLHKAKIAFPRRQEAERDICQLPDGSQLSAFVTRREVREWSKGTKHCIICSVSHCWETREHPDPCRFQLEQLVNYVSLKADFYDIWLFYDYMSLFQFERQTDQEEASFRQSMANMHVLYAHESTRTLRIQSLTPKPIWEAMLSSEARVHVYHLDTGGIAERPLKDLVANRTPYGDRGWCKAEVEWSSTRTSTASNQCIDSTEGQAELDGSSPGRVPTIPEVFEKQMAQAAFTHRSDALAVFHLQKKIFFQKVSVCEESELEHLPKAEVAALARALPEYQSLRSLRLHRFDCGPAEAKAFCQAVTRLGALRELVATNCQDPVVFVKALGEALQHNSAILKIDLGFNRIGDEGAKALGEVLKQNSAITTINLDYNSIGDEGAQALGEGLKHNNAVALINLKFNCIGDVGAQAFGEALLHNSVITQIDLKRNHISDGGAKALGEALQHNSVVTQIDLKWNRISDEGWKALAPHHSRINLLPVHEPDQGCG